MKVKIIQIIIIIFCLNVPAFAQDFKGQKIKLAIQGPEKKYKVGETLKYSIEWLGIPVGLVILNINGIEKINNYDCYHITGKAMPNDFLKHIVDLEYEVNSYIDTKSHFTRRFEKIRRLKGKVTQVSINFDPEKGLADFQSEGSAGVYVVSTARKQLNKIMPTTNKIPKGTQDLLSSLYYFRLLNLEEVSNYSVNIYYDRRNWDFTFTVGKPFLKEIRKKGTFAAFEISPNSQLNDFILGKRKFSILFTADSRRVPVGFSFATGVGSIQARIQEIPK